MAPRASERAELSPYCVVVAISITAHASGAIKATLAASFVQRGRTRTKASREQIKRAIQSGDVCSNSIVAKSPLGGRATYWRLFHSLRLAVWSRPLMGHPYRVIGSRGPKRVAINNWNETSGLLAFFEATMVSYAQLQSYMVQS
jgi:hypothetical protein